MILEKDDKKTLEALKDNQSLLDDFKESISKWAGAESYYREDWECEYFHVAGKFFCLYTYNHSHGLIMTVKGLPEDNELLREQYDFVIPGYHVNKTHWNSIKLSEAIFSREELLALLKQSYDLVTASLPKKVQKELRVRKS